MGTSEQWKSLRIALGCLGEGEEVFDVGADGAVDALDLRVARLDDVVLVGSVGAAAVAEAEVARGEAQGVAGEDVAGPGASETRKNDRIDAVLAIDGDRGLDDGGVGGRAGGVVAAGHVDFDVAEAALGEMGFERGESF